MKFIKIIWEYFPPFMMMIIITIMYVWEQQKDVQPNVSIQEESCDFPISPQPELIEY